MKVAVIAAPYDSGHLRSGFGLGPGAILAGGLLEGLAGQNHDVTLREVSAAGDAQGREIATGFAVCNAVAAATAAVRAEGRFPIILAGNCLTSAGAVAGESADSIIWFDQHGDLNTPETSAYGFLDGMALAVVLGLCWKPITAQIPGFHPLDPSRCMLVDARDLDPDEKGLLAHLPVHHVALKDAAAGVERLRSAGATKIHMHLDLDVLDPAIIMVNRYMKPGGPGPEALIDCVCSLAKGLPIVGLTVSAYDPQVDQNGEVPKLVKELATRFLAASASF